MNCSKCATPLPDNARFCLTCGADVSRDGHGHEKTVAQRAEWQEDITQVSEWEVRRYLGTY